MKNIIIYTLGMIFLLNTSTSLPAQLHDLQKMQQDFVLETKKINIPGYPDAFNPSIVQWKGRLLMSFRYYAQDTRSTDGIGLVWLNNNFEPIGKPSILQRKEEVCCQESFAQDPRLLVIDNKIYIVYSNNYPGTKEIIRRVTVGIIHCDNSNFTLKSINPILHFDGESQEKKEKNWAPFDYKNTLMLAYTINPHIIFQPQHMGCCDTIAATNCTMDWNWGDLKGGTPALLVDEQYLAFFHTVKAMATVQSDSKMMTHYFMGAYTFNKEPPFDLEKISPTPIVGKQFYEGPMYNTWKPLRVVYPCGYIFDDDYIWVSYGRQDHELWIVKLDKQKLLASLKPIKNSNSKKKAPK